MTLTLSNVTFDCEDALVVASFWSAALGRPLATDPEPSSAFACIGNVEHEHGDGVNWLFWHVPEKRTVKNRVHVDLAATDVEAEIDRLVGLGATRVEDKDEFGAQWSIMQDPEGNEFCVAQG
jgi:predicted enzyme related to lactoylglutathione lyase